MTSFKAFKTKCLNKIGLFTLEQIAEYEIRLQLMKAFGQMQEEGHRKQLEGIIKPKSN